MMLRPSPWGLESHDHKTPFLFWVSFTERAGVNLSLVHFVPSNKHIGNFRACLLYHLKRTVAEGPRVPMHFGEQIRVRPSHE